MLSEFCDNQKVKAVDINSYLEGQNTSGLKHSVKLSNLILRPQINLSSIAKEYKPLMEAVGKIDLLQNEVCQSVEIKIKYNGYIEREKIIADKIKRLENIKIHNDFEYTRINSLSTEARQKLERIKPETIGQASRIPGVSPSDINVLLVFLGR